MLTGKEFVAKIREGNAELFAQSRDNVRRFFASNPSQEHMVEHFRGRMVNEAANMRAISAEIAAAPASMDVTELELLTKQAQDEAKHFRMVKEVIEHISGEEVDVEAAFAAEELLLLRQKVHPSSTSMRHLLILLLLLHTNSLQKVVQKQSGQRWQSV